MSSPALNMAFNRARIDDRLVNELLGLCQGVLADGRLEQSEVEFIQKWLVVNQLVTNNPVAAILLSRIDAVLQDGIMDEEERADLLSTLKAFSGGDFELGELSKSCALPLDDPAPQISFNNKHFCFTGTFAYGVRDDCEKAVIERGARAGRITHSTDYLIIGCYATDSWAHSSYGRKIEKAVEIRTSRGGLCIVSEDHWLAALESAQAYN